MIIGPSGSGKSTTVRCMNFLEEPTSGHVYIDGQELTAKNKTKQEAEELPQNKRHPLWIEQPMGDGRESRPGCGLYK
mgnify:FL=1